MSLAISDDTRSQLQQGAQAIDPTSPVGAAPQEGVGATQGRPEQPTSSVVPSGEAPLASSATLFPKDDPRSHDLGEAAVVGGFQLINQLAMGIPQLVMDHIMNAQERKDWADMRGRHDIANYGAGAAGFAGSMVFGGPLFKASAKVGLGGYAAIMGTEEAANAYRAADWGIGAAKQVAPELEQAVAHGIGNSAGRDAAVQWAAEHGVDAAGVSKNIQVPLQRAAQALLWSHLGPAGPAVALLGDDKMLGAAKWLADKAAPHLIDMAHSLMTTHYADIPRAAAALMAQKALEGAVLTAPYAAADASMGDWQGAGEAMAWGGGVNAAVGGLSPFLSKAFSKAGEVTGISDLSHGLVEMATRAPKGRMKELGASAEQVKSLVQHIEEEGAPGADGPLGVRQNLQKFEGDIRVKDADHAALIDRANQLGPSPPKPMVPTMVPEAGTLPYGATGLSVPPDAAGNGPLATAQTEFPPQGGDMATAQTEFPPQGGGINLPPWEASQGGDIHLPPMGDEKLVGQHFADDTAKAEARANDPELIARTQANEQVRQALQKYKFDLQQRLEELRANNPADYDKEIGAKMQEGDFGDLNSHPPTVIKPDYGNAPQGKTVPHGRLEEALQRNLHAADVPNEQRGISDLRKQLLQLQDADAEEPGMNRAQIRAVKSEMTRLGYPPPVEAEVPLPGTATTGMPTATQLGKLADSVDNLPVPLAQKEAVHRSIAASRQALADEAAQRLGSPTVSTDQAALNRQLAGTRTAAALMKTLPAVANEVPAQTVGGQLSKVIAGKYADAGGISALTKTPGDAQATKLALANGTSTAMTTAVQNALQTQAIHNLWTRLIDRTPEAFKAAAASKKAHVGMTLSQFNASRDQVNDAVHTGKAQQHVGAVATQVAPSPGVAQAFSSTALGAVSWLAQQIPQPPPGKPGGPPPRLWQPTVSQLMAYGAKEEIVMDPLKAIDRIRDGSLNKDHVLALQQFPVTYQKIVGQVMAGAQNASLGPKQRQVMSVLLHQPVGSAGPIVGMLNQATLGPPMGPFSTPPAPSEPPGSPKPSKLKDSMLPDEGRPSQKGKK